MQPTFVPTVSIPGAPGANAYTNTSANFVVPAIGSTVTVSVLNSACFVVNEIVLVAGPAHFLVTAIPSSTSVTLQFLGYPIDVAVGSTILAGVEVTPADGPQGQDYTLTTTTILLPASAGNVVLPTTVVSSRWMTAGMTLVAIGLNGAGNAVLRATFSVLSVAPGTCNLTWLNAAGDSAGASTFASSA